MRKVAIIGGGQSGLQLALGLLQNKYEVTLVSSMTVILLTLLQRPSDLGE